jgi:rapamycin-insensitive companion of mTOR
MASADGLRYLSNEDLFLVQIVKSFAQLDPVSSDLSSEWHILTHHCVLKFNGLPDSDPIFSKKRVSDTLTYGYLEMLGTLSKHKEGVE